MLSLSSLFLGGSPGTQGCLSPPQQHAALLMQSSHSDQEYWPPRKLGDPQYWTHLDQHVCDSTGSTSGQPEVAWLWSYPGSGSTWTRLLIEAASGFGAGSVYNDSTLFGELDEEQDITKSLEGLIVVKTHTLAGKTKPVSKRCHLPNMWHKIKHAVIIVRDPFES